MSFPPPIVGIEYDIHSFDPVYVVTGQAVLEGTMKNQVPIPPMLSPVATMRSGSTGSSRIAGSSSSRHACSLASSVQLTAKALWPNSHGAT